MSTTRNQIVALLFVFALIVFGATQVGAQGTLTLESIAEQVNGLIGRLDKVEETDQQLKTKIADLENRVLKLEPTSTPLVIATSTPSAQDKMVYNNQVLRILYQSDDHMSFISAMETMGTLFFQAAENSTLLYDEQWIRAVLESTAALRVIYLESQEIVPPESMKATYDKLKEGLFQCDKGADKIDKWLKTYLPHLLEQGSMLLDLCSQVLYEEMRLE